jgi:hypothetical protein
MAVKHECHAQTNTNSPPAQGQQLPDSTAQDWQKALGDVGIHVNVQTIGSVWFLIYLTSKYLRNKTSLGSGPVGNFLSSVLNAEQKTLPPKP